MHRTTSCGYSVEDDSSHYKFCWLSRQPLSAQFFFFFCFSISLHSRIQKKHWLFDCLYCSFLSYCYPFLHFCMLFCFSFSLSVFFCFFLISFFLLFLFFSVFFFALYLVLLAVIFCSLLWSLPLTPFLP